MYESTFQQNYLKNVKHVRECQKEVLNSFSKLKQLCRVSAVGNIKELSKAYSKNTIVVFHTKAGSIYISYVNSSAYCNWKNVQKDTSCLKIFWAQNVLNKIFNTITTLKN